MRGWRAGLRGVAGSTVEVEIGEGGWGDGWRGWRRGKGGC